MSTEVGKLFFDQQPVNSDADLLSRYGVREFESPYRSTVPLLSLLRHGRAELERLLSEVGLSQTPDLHLEYTVPTLRSRGYASHTDLMARTTGAAVAFEAKWTEPSYSMVESWLRRGNQENRLKRLEEWAHMLQRTASEPLDVSALDGIVYQMLHRAASACAASDNAGLVYLVFTPSPSSQTVAIQKIRTDLAKLRAWLGEPGFDFFLAEVRLTPTSAFSRISALPKGSAETAAAVRAALLGEPLFGFELVPVERVG